MDNQIKILRSEFAYLKENIIITWKTLIEFKYNLAFSIIEHTIYILTHIFLFFLLINNFGDIIGWNMHDFFIFFIMTEITYIIAGLFIWKDTLNLYIVRGDLNTFLFRPQNPYIAFFYSSLNNYAFLLLIIDSIYYTTAILLLNIELYNLLLSSLVFILITILYIVNIEMIRSFDFLAKNIVDTALWSPFIGVNELLKKFPYDFFQTSFFKYVILIIPNVLVASLLLPLLRGHDIFNPILQIIILLSLIFSYTIIIKLNWRYGLKRYEAFG